MGGGAAGAAAGGAGANIGCVFVCMKSARLIAHDKEVSHFSNIDPLYIPDWCELEEYTGTKNISFFDENGNG